MPINVQQSLTVSGQPLKHKITITDFRTVGVKTFFRVSKQDPTIHQWLNVQRFDHDKQRNLSHTNIIEQVTALRVVAYDSIVAKLCEDGGGQEPEASLSFDDGTDDRKQRPSRAVIAQLPATVDITTPKVGDVEGITTSVLTGNAHAPLYMELNEEVITYMGAAVQYQIENLQLKRTRLSRKRSSSDIASDPLTEQDVVPVEPTARTELTRTPSDSKKDPMNLPQKSNFKYQAGQTTVALKTVHTKDKDTGLKGLRRYFSARTEDGNTSLVLLHRPRGTKTGARQALAM